MHRVKRFATPHEPHGAGPNGDDDVRRVPPKYFPSPRFGHGARPGLGVQSCSAIRACGAQVYARQSIAAAINGLDSFAYFGGVPHEVLFDQMKTVILDHQRVDGGTLLGESAVPACSRRTGVFAFARVGRNA